MLPFTSLDAASATGPGTVLDLGTTRRLFSVAAFKTGSPSSVAVELEGSHDGVNWAPLATVNVDATPSFTNASTYIVRYVRANLTTLAGGSSPTVTATIAAMKG